MSEQNELAKTAKTTTFSTFITEGAIKQKINEIIGGKDGQRFMTQILSAVTNNLDLQKCDHMTILNCAFLGESLKLSPSPQLGQYYMVPFKDTKNGRMVSTFILGYKGYLQLAIRSGYYKKINVLAIKEGELVRYNPLEEEIEVNLMQDEEAREGARTVGYYAMFEYTNGFRKAMYWSKSKMEVHANTHSAAFNLKSYQLLQEGKIKAGDLWKYSSFWYKDFDGMAFKTMIRQLISKWGIMSIDLQTAYENDTTFKDDKGNINYVDSGNDAMVDADIEQNANTVVLDIGDYSGVDTNTGEISDPLNQRATVGATTTLEFAGQMPVMEFGN